MIVGETTHKVCSRCKAEKSVDDFYKRRDRNGERRYLDPWCKPCRNAAQKVRRESHPGIHAEAVRDWKRRHPEKTRRSNNESRRRSNERRRLRMIEAYGGKCACCGESDPHFLTVDHINGRPPEHRGVTGLQLLSKLEAEGYPDTCQVLCWNCNCSKSRYGACPHHANFVPYYA